MNVTWHKTIPGVKCKEVEAALYDFNSIVRKNVIALDLYFTKDGEESPIIGTLGNFGIRENECGRFCDRQAEVSKRYFAAITHKLGCDIHRPYDTGDARNGFVSNVLFFSCSIEAVFDLSGKFLRIFHSCSDIKVYFAPNESKSEEATRIDYTTNGHYLKLNTVTFAKTVEAIEKSAKQAILERDAEKYLIEAGLKEKGE